MNPMSGGHKLQTNTPSREPGAQLGLLQDEVCDGHGSGVGIRSGETGGVVRGGR